MAMLGLRHRTCLLAGQAGLPAPKLGLNCVGGSASAAVAKMLAAGGTMVTYGEHVACESCARLSLACGWHRLHSTPHMLGMSALVCAHKRLITLSMLCACSAGRILDRHGKYHDAGL